MRTSSSGSGKLVPLDAILLAVANEQCRPVLRVLSHTEGVGIEIGSLTDQVAEHVRYGGRLFGDHQQRVRTALHHIHLPKLGACGLIAYDAESMDIRSVNRELSRELLALVESIGKANDSIGSRYGIT